MTAKTNAERQAAYRARKRASATVEVRGIYATPAHAALIKEFARALKCSNK